MGRFQSMQQERPKHFRPHTNLPTGEDLELQPLEPIDLSRVSSFADLTREMKNTPFEGRNVGLAVETLVEMAKDPDTFVVMTISGAMTPAKMGLIICDALDRGLVQAVVSTGALMAHGYVESVGMKHYLAPPGVSDEEHYKRGFNRIHTALEPEKNLDDVEEIFNEVASQFDPNKAISSSFIMHKLGEYLEKNVEGRGILKSAYRMGIPVFVPAFTDSELGLDLGIVNRKRASQNKVLFQYNPLIDLDLFTEIVRRQKKFGIFTIGGGVPRNWAQQVGPYIDLLAKRAGSEEGEPVMYSYAVRICPEPVNWGGLSGCTYEEGKSWGKFEPDAKTVELLSDATVIWPLIAKAVFEELEGVTVHGGFSGYDVLQEASAEVKKLYPNIAAFEKPSSFMD